MKEQFIQIGYMDSRLEKSMKLLTPEVFHALTTSEHVCQTMARIEAEPDAEKKAELKQQLPVVLYACQMPEGGVRPSAKNGLAHESGFCLHDWDHMPQDPRAFYMSRIAGREQELGIVLAHVTPRGEGLRLVTVREAGEQIVDCQARMAKAFGMEQYADTKVKDITRLSYLPSRDYVLYVDERGLFEQPMTAAQPVVAAEPARVATMTVDPVPQQQVPNPAESSIYNGLRYSQIIEALMKRLATNGQVRTGERNNVLYRMTRELRHIVDYNYNTTYLFLRPYFADLPDAEVRSTIGSALATNGRNITPMLKGVLDELRDEYADAEAVEDGLQLPRLPRVSAVEEMLLSHYPKHLRGQAYLAMLPIWGVYGTNIRFDYLDGRENSLSFMTAVVGKSGSGKAFAAHLFEQMTQSLQQQDAAERRKADQYQALCNRMSDDAEKPDDPRPRVRIFGDDITTNQLLEYLDNNEGRHCIQFTEEVARLQKAKRTIYGDNDDLYCKSFDNGVGGKESKSKLTRNIRTRIFLNTLFCGTPGAMHKFYNNPEGGLNNRIIYAFMPKVRTKGFPRYSSMSVEERQQFDEVTQRLSEAGKDGVKVVLPWLEREIMNIKNRWDRDDEENPNEVWYDLGKRSLVMAMRAGVLAWHLRGCTDDPKQQREICKVVRWVADVVRQSVYAFSGKDYEDINEADNTLQPVCMTKNRKLFSLLPDEFTTQDLITLRMQNGGNSNVAMVICRWKGDGMIRKVADGRYQKVA